MDNDDKIKKLISAVEKDGAACSTVKDGHVLMFKRAFLQKLLSENSSHEQIVIFVKRYDLNN
jgi:hypothetical protein